MRTRGGVYRRGLYTLGNRDNAPPERTQSLRIPTEQMDTDDTRCASEEIYRRIRHQTGLSRSSSTGDVTLQPEPLGVMTQGRLILHRRTSDQPQVAQSDARDQSVRDPEAGVGAEGGVSLLNIPPCSMAEEELYFWINFGWECSNLNVWIQPILSHMCRHINFSLLALKA